MTDRLTLEPEGAVRVFYERLRAALPEGERSAYQVLLDWAVRGARLTASKHERDWLAWRSTVGAAVGSDRGADAGRRSFLSMRCWGVCVRADWDALPVRVRDAFDEAAGAVRQWAAGA